MGARVAGLNTKQILLFSLGMMFALTAGLALWWLTASRPAEVCSTAPGSDPAASPRGETPTCSFTVVREFPHDAGAFTQGLQFVEGEWIEGTGLNGQSSLRRVDLETGTVEQQVPLAPEYFGEGVTVLGEKIYQLTWQSRVGFVYDVATLEQVATFAYETEGWGLTNDGTRLIMSDGSAKLYFLETQNLTVTGAVTVTDNGNPITQLNELEYINGFVYANVWHSEQIAKIDPQTGQVAAWLDLSGLRPTETLGSPEAVLNGIAYDAATDRLFVTGKLWPKIFEIELQSTK
jgi:glutamine cyclotransferase